MSGLFTVLIAEKEHIDAIRQGNKLFFEPFLESEELAFCYWNPAGQNLQDSVPGLLDAVGQRKNWRAVIINNSADVTLKTRNPFDVVDCSALNALTPPSRQPGENESLECWEASWKEHYDGLTAEKEAVFKSALTYPFQRLCTWLCFRPEDYILHEVHEKQDAHDWAMEMLGRDDLKPSVKLELLERDQYKAELRMKENLRRDFVVGNYLNVAYPAEVHCISLRSVENNYFDPDAYWNIRQESEYSTFADRNMYFDRMRFMVFDLLPPTHRNFRTDYIRFLATILVFASNPIPGSAMQPRHLYQLEAEADNSPLCTLVTSYDRKLAATFEVIEGEMEKIRSEIPGELTDKAAEALFCTPQDVTVLLDESCDPEKVFVENDYGFFFDSPEDESYKWSRNYQASEAALTYITKQQSRSIRKSVSQMHSASAVPDINISRLTPLQIDDVREYTNAAENEMVASIPADLTDISLYTQRMAQEGEKVKKEIGRRMTRKTTTILSILCLALCFICFLPFLLANGGTTRTVTTAILLSLAMMAVLAIILLVALFFMRSSVVNAVRGYNNTAREVMNDIQADMKRVSKYLSASCNVRRGHTVQNYAEKNTDEYTRSLRIRRRHQEDIRKKRAYLAEEYGDYFGDRSCCDETMSRPYEYDFDQKTEFTYPAPFLAGDCRQIEFISGGNFVTVPSSYITRILVRMEGIYEK
jgi:hypothetical protein